LAQARCRDEEEFGLDLGGRRRIRVVLPEDGALGLEPVENHQPVEVAQASAVQTGVGAAAGGVLTGQEIALDLAFCHAIEEGQCE